MTEILTDTLDAVILNLGNTGDWDCIGIKAHGCIAWIYERNGQGHVRLYIRGSTDYNYHNAGNYAYNLLDPLCDPQEIIEKIVKMAIVD